MNPFIYDLNGNLIPPSSPDTWKILDQDGELRAEFPAALGDQVLEYLQEIHQNLGYDKLVAVLAEDSITEDQEKLLKHALGLYEYYGEVNKKPYRNRFSVPTESYFDNEWKILVEKGYAELQLSDPFYNNYRVTQKGADYLGVELP